MFENKLIGSLDLVCASDKCPTIKRQIIGPRSSDTLRGMVEEARAPPSTGGWRNLADAPFFAYGATVPDSIVLNGLNSKSAEDCLRDQAQLRLSRTIASDEALATAIVDELKLRGVEPGPDQHVMLISESDTLYGRTAPESFEKAFIESAKKTHPAGAESPSKWIFERTFLHGLDGALPQSGKEDNKSEAPSKAAKGQSEADTRGADRPYGQGQDDYLRRLADDLKAQDTEGGDETRAGVAAIGVIGGDVFDKLRVLRALKPEFPEALFFTTDYDASLTMQSELHFTRNLLIASSFGPQLRPERQCHIPPFRDVYESSAFLATQLAMTEEGHPASCPSLWAS